MPIHADWLGMIQSMKKQYKQGKIACRSVGGKSICASAKAWSVFFATGTKRYGKGFETKPRAKKVEEVFQWREWVKGMYEVE